MQPNAIVLLSGGLDSATVLALAHERGFTCHCLSFHYGQRHRLELQAASYLARAAGSPHRIVRVELPWSTDALTSATDVPKGRPIHDGIPLTYVPARNMIFLAHAVSFAEAVGAVDIFAGMNAVDYSGYPDCRPAFLHAFQAMARLGTKVGVEGAEITVHAPLLQMTKADIVREAVRLGVPYGKTLSCYDPSFEGTPCEACDSCQLRARGFEEAGIVDPTRVGR